MLASSVKTGVEFVRDLKLKRPAESLAGLLAGNTKFPALRPVVLDALAAVDDPRLIELAAELMDRGDVPQEQRQHAIQVLGGLNRDKSRTLLLSRLKTAPSSTALLLARGLRSVRQMETSYWRRSKKGRLRLVCCRIRRWNSGCGFRA